ncbi:diadenylate cyclase CdaA [bacterium]|nr:diadenylate cyclase CdaA [candidate division CSSED10-310 bacterium]
MASFLFNIGDFYIRLWDVLDILIVAYLIYRAFVLIKGTLTVQILLGLSILFLLMKFSQQYELITLHRLLLQFWQNWVLLAIVLFQPEIRRALAHMGSQWPFFKRHRLKKESVVEEICNAAVSLAESRIGALIVLERETGLANIREMGMKLDAQVTSELLRTIFYPHSPLHDGAVIIYNQRINAAACFLPLTKNPLLARSLGTRHRAAIGVTEETDALTVVVSEERGTISLALRGSLEKITDADHLKRRLTHLLDPQSDIQPVQKEHSDD